MELIVPNTALTFQPFSVSVSKLTLSLCRMITKSCLALASAINTFPKHQRVQLAHFVLSYAGAERGEANFRWGTRRLNNKNLILQKLSIFSNFYPTKCSKDGDIQVPLVPTPSFALPVLVLDVNRLSVLEQHKLKPLFQSGDKLFYV